MSLVDLNKIAAIEIVPGYHARFFHSDNMTVAHWQIEQDAALPEHSHPHEQIVNVISGEFELTVDGVIFHLVPGNVFVIPGGVPHAGKAVTPCHLIDVFHPVREDYRSIPAPG